MKKKLMLVLVPLLLVAALVYGFNRPRDDLSTAPDVATTNEGIAADESAVAVEEGLECPLDPNELSSPLLVKDENIKTLQEAKVDTTERSITHVIALPDAVEVEFIAGGCAHYGFHYRFSKLIDVPAADDAAFFSFVRGQVARLPYDTSDSREFMVSAVEALEANAAEWTDKAVALESPMGDATVWLERSDDGFKLSYDFPL